ncbi:MAG TPA: hypothetical protein VMZ51_02100 [Acidimicrobiales bacterium]|nr:hypothetical protein [Acidimicrobiales bacterium]
MTTKARLSTFTDPKARVTTYRHDPAGNVVSKQDHGGDCVNLPRSGCTTYGYDVADQVKSIAYSDAVTPNIT